MFRACQRASINTFLTRSSRQLNAFKFSTTVSQRKDPWLLPNTPEHEVKTRSDPNIPQLPPIPRPDESVETTRARLVYQSRKRGTLESDLLLSTFAQQNLGSMQEAELKEYDRLLDEPDWDIYYWATEKRPAPEYWAESPLLAKLRIHARNEGKEIRRMPDLGPTKTQ